MTCMTCHSAGDAQIPALVDRSASRLEGQLLDFKYDRVKVTLMNRLAKGYTDAELAAVAAYLAGSSSHAGH
jgi:cytochrome subunit of sulfide dehydrogenase